ncbi:SDR family oxidoreductase [Monashia sp. NPDC004114]
MRIVVIGGTGLIGSKLVAKLSEHGHDAVAAAPNTGVNTLTGEGLAEVLQGTEVVVDVANSPSFEAQAVMDFFRTSTGNLLAAEAAAGVRHHVGLSIVGTERMPENHYFAAKIAQEELIRQSGVPFSLVHATQFYEFVPAIADDATVGTTVHIAPTAWQPIAGEDVATNLGRIAVGEPLNGSIDIAGPEQFQMDEFFRKALAARYDPRDVVTDRHARYFGSELSERSLVPIGDAILGEVRYDDWAARATPGK